MSDMEGRRIECIAGHVLATLKTEPGEAGDAFAHKVVQWHGDRCPYCKNLLAVARVPLSDFEHWSSRVDRYEGTGAPTS